MNSDILGILTRAKGGSFATFTFTSYLVILSMHSVNRLRRLIADASWLFSHGSVCMSILLWQFAPSSSPLVPTDLFSPSAPLFLPWNEVHLHRFSRCHIYAAIANICFSLSDLLHSARQTLDPSTSLQMTHFHSSLVWVNMTFEFWGWSWFQIVKVYFGFDCLCPVVFV